MAIIKTSKLITIDRHLANEEHLHPEVSDEFTSILRDLTFSVRLISKEIRSAGLNDILGMTTNTNVHGEKVRKLDEFANEVILRFMENDGNICVMASEESVDLIKVKNNVKKGSYVLIFDPMDGSTNIDSNISIGSIFSILRRVDVNSEQEGGLDDILQPGFKQAAACYVLYGSSTIFVYTTGDGVNVFTLDPSIGEFLITFENIKIPTRGRQYSCNEGNYFLWEEATRKYINYIKTPSILNPKPYTQRYVATAVADIHRILHYGGIYLYPKDTTYPNGKIRLLYEANPLSMIIEQAGGKATTGTERILDIIPKSIHQTVPFIVGSPDNVSEYENFIKSHKS